MEAGLRILPMPTLQFPVPTLKLPTLHPPEPTLQLDDSIQDEINRLFDQLGRKLQRIADLQDDPPTEMQRRKEETGP